MKKLLTLAAVLMLIGCDSDPSYYHPKDMSPTFQMPDVLIDRGCKIYVLKAPDEYNLNVVYCPNHTTTSTSTRRSSGKSTAPQYTVVIDGNEYVRAPETTNDTNKHN